MSKKWLTRLTIPLVDNEPHRKWEPLVFRQWLPLRESDSLIVKDGELELRFWIDKSCLAHLDFNLDNVPQCGNIFVGKLNVDVTGPDLTEAFADLVVKLSSERNWTLEYLSEAYGSQLVDEYGAFGAKVYSAVTTRFNRLIAYVRARKGQYWLREYKAEPNQLSSEFLKLSAMIRIDDRDWLRLSSPGPNVIRMTLLAGERLIAEREWDDICEHVSGERKPPLVGQLLAGADEFRDSGHRRAALTEAVSALEIAVSQFSQRTNPDHWSTLLAGRSSSTRFSNHVEHLGTTCTVGYLLPVIFSEQQMPSAMLKTCQEAIDVRNAVIHRGQREVDEENLRQYLQAIRELCDILQRLQTGPD